MLTVVQEWLWAFSKSALESIILPKGGENLFESISPSLLRDEDKNHNTWEGQISRALLIDIIWVLRFQKPFAHKRKTRSYH